MKNKKAVIIIEIILCALFTLAIFFISHYAYADVYQITIPISVLTSYIVVSLINFKNESKNLEHRFRYFTAILLIITSIFIFSTKPDYTYQDGLKIVKEKQYNNVSILHTKSILSFNFEQGAFINNSYLYVGEKNNQKFYLLVSPINGEVETFDYHGNHYINRFFELTES